GHTEIGRAVQVGRRRPHFCFRMIQNVLFIHLFDCSIGWKRTENDLPDPANSMPDMPNSGSPLHVALSGSGPAVRRIIGVRREKGYTMRTTDVAQGSELRDLLAQFAPRDGDHHTSIASVCLMRRSSSLTPEFTILSPALCLAAQGQKEFMLGKDVYAVGSGHHLVVSTHLPVSALVLEATPVKPFLGLILGLHLTNLRSLIEEARLPTPVAGVPARGLYVSRTA